MRGVLVDAGPLVAMMDAGDAFHDVCVAAFKRLREPLFTVWPVITEAMYVVGSPVAQEQLWTVLDARHLALLPLDARDFPRMRALMQKYRNLPMDLTDAALVRVAERDGFQTVLTVDRTDFAVYRMHGNKRFHILP